MGKKSLLLIAGGVVSIFLTGCAMWNLKVSQPVSQSASGVMIKIPGICPVLIPCSDQIVTFARLGDDDLISSEIYQTSTMKNNHYYLLNARPGKYVAVAATYSRGTSIGGSAGNISGVITRVFGENILFSSELVEKTKIELLPGSLAIMGEFDFSVDGRMALAPSASQFLKNADSVQAHYAKAIDSEMESRGAMSSIKFYRGTLKSVGTDPGSKQKLLELARKHIGAEGWESQLANSKM
ncbi:hypothetical protein MNBD_NITROSPIRAE01-1064 [hydrothermal vent metagenome]|uniref:Uncharacterized protein n=1 Tax=hydrothermal vent metagenome TaxID=652676 RepID=A0A3B1CPV5_9ZZZZ